jgi:hypothetical protein
MIRESTVRQIILVCTTAVCLAGTATAQSSGVITFWGRNDYGENSPPPNNSSFVAVSPGSMFNLGLKANGSIYAWGPSNQYGQCTIPAPNSGFTTVAAGVSHSLCLRADGSIAAFGYNLNGECNVPLPNEGFTAVAGGLNFSAGLKSDGTLLVWGSSQFGQGIGPVPNTGFTAVGAGYRHGLAVKADGSVVGWGQNSEGQCDVPSPNTGFVAVAGGYAHSLGLKADGSLAAWGRNAEGQCNLPSPNSGFVAIAAGFYHNLALREDGTVVAWGLNDHQQCNVPASLGSCSAIDATHYRSLAVGGAPPVSNVVSASLAARRDNAAIVTWTFSVLPDIAGLRLWRQESARDRVCVVGAVPSVRGRDCEFIDPTPPRGVADYWLQELAPDGAEIWHGPTRLASAAIPAALALTQNTPNPFNPRTTIGFSLPATGRVLLAIYDLRGARIAILVDADLPAGEQSAEWDGLNSLDVAVPSGVYLARLETEAGLRTVKVTLAR